MRDGSAATVSRRDLLSLIGTVAGSAAMYHAMTNLGFAADSAYQGPIKLSGDVKGRSVLVLGAGLAGMTAALELRKAGYKVQVLEFNSRAGGRNWTLRGGDTFTELGGFTQTCAFEPGLYLNPGPWRIPYHHRALLDYCKRLNVALEPFVELNHNALLHASGAFGGKPQRIRDVQADFQGQIAELLSKATTQGKLDEAVSRGRQRDFAAGAAVLGRARSKLRLQGQSDLGRGARLCERSRRRSWRGADCRRTDRSFGDSQVAAMALSAEFFDCTVPDHDVSAGRRHGHDRQGVRTRSRRSHSLRTPRCPGSNRTTAASPSPMKTPKNRRRCRRHGPTGASAPFRFHSQPNPDQRRPPPESGDRCGALCVRRQIGLQFKRRFWEEDDGDLRRHQFHRSADPADRLSEHGLKSRRPGILLGAYIFEGPMRTSSPSMPPRGARCPRRRVRPPVIHPQYPAEFENGVAVAWHRVPFTLGCAGHWTEETRAAHYDDLCQIDGRIVLAGEHASYLPAWQEGAILSSLNAITRLHDRVVKT